MSKLIGADYLLLFLYLNNKTPIRGAVRLTKMMFLFNEEIVPILKDKNHIIDNLPEFIPYNYGPFSKDVYNQIELFKSIGFVKVTNINSSEIMDEVDDWEEDAFLDEMIEQEQWKMKEDGKYLKYEITTLGSKYVEDKILPIDTHQITLLESFKNKISNSYPKQILKYVYTKYPKYASNSLILNEVINND